MRVNAIQLIGIEPMKAVVWTLVLSLLFVMSANATINVIVSTYDGIVMVADSRLTLRNDSITRIESDNGEKIVRVGSHSAVAISGGAFLYDDEVHLRSMSSVIGQLKSSRHISDEVRISPREVLRVLDSALAALFQKPWGILNASQGSIQCLVSGYDGENRRCIYSLVYPNIVTQRDGSLKITGIVDTIFPSQTPGAYAAGQTDVWFKLIKGYDQRLIGYTPIRTRLAVRPKESDSTKLDSTWVTDTLRVDDLRYNARYDLMNLQDGVDFALFVARATIESQRFDQGSLQGIGGSIDVAVITTDGFQWLQRKSLHGEAQDLGH